MGFVERELNRVTTRLQNAGPLAADESSQLYAVQQALLWAISPDSFKSPYDMIVPTSDTQQAVEGCLAETDHSLSSNTLDHRAS
jgi:hypothetical protein